jgi:ribonuclease P/MRP protein subunit POP5
MVRIKERYLLVNIIYPPDTTESPAVKVPDFVVQHQPTIEKVTPQALLKGIRAEVGLLFGDVGLGAFEGKLSGEITS